MALTSNDSQIVSVRVVGTFGVAPDSPADAAEDSLVYCLGLGATLRGLYIQKADGSYERLAEGGEIGGGWTYVKLTSDEVSTSTSAADTALAFTPAADTHYEIEGKFFLESVATSTGVRPGIKWPTSGLDRNAAWMMSPSNATAFASRFWGNTSSQAALATGVAVANEGQFGEVKGMFVTGASTAGDFVITIRSEIDGSQVKINADSFIRYRAI